MNMADNVKSEDSSDSENDDEVKNVTPTKAADGLQTFNPQSDSKTNESIRSSSSTMSKRGLMLDKTPNGTIYQSTGMNKSN